jgi:PhzF family phenazine biosynthesis protein
MKYYVVDVFTDAVFGGNPAGICLLDTWIDESLMQKIAFENNLSETAFLVKQDGYYDLRWFTPEVEMDLCGHATLGSAYILMQFVDPKMKQVAFHTQSGILTVTRDADDVLIMDFPSRKPNLCPIPDMLEKALGTKVLETHMSRDMLVVVENEKIVKDLVPDFSLLKNIDQPFAIIVTARGDDCDFVSRFFAPNAGIDEDPVTGSAHCTLIPFWSERIGKSEMLARQLSLRGGRIICRDCGDRVKIGGVVQLYLAGEIMVEGQ